MTQESGIQRSLSSMIVFRFHKRKAALNEFTKFFLGCDVVVVMFPKVFL